MAIGYGGNDPEQIAFYRVGRNSSTLRVLAAGTSTPIRTVNNVGAYRVAAEPFGNFTFAGFGGTSGTVLPNGTVVPITGTPHAFAVATYP